MVSSFPITGLSFEPLRRRAIGIRGDSRADNYVRTFLTRRASEGFARLLCEEHAPPSIAATIDVEEHHVGRLAGDVGGTPSHCDPDVGFFECPSVIDAVARHRHDLALGTDDTGKAKLLFRRDPREDHVALRQPGAIG